MTITFTEGFEHKGAKFGWHKKKLYRLPLDAGRNYYSMMEIPAKEFNGVLCYRCRGDRLTINKAREMTVKVLWEIKRVAGKHVA